MNLFFDLSIISESPYRTLVTSGTSTLEDKSMIKLFDVPSQVSPHMLLQLDPHPHKFPLESISSIVLESAVDLQVASHISLHSASHVVQDIVSAIKNTPCY